MQTSKLIIQLFCGEPVRPLCQSDWVTIIRVLRHQQCLARMSWRIRQKHPSLQLPEYALNHFYNAELVAKKQYDQVQNEAALLNKMLAPITNHLLFLKGAAYSLKDNMLAGRGRTYSDIDLLVDKPSLNRVEKELALHGFFSEELDDYDERYYREWAHEIPPLRHGSRGTVLDVHHNLTPPISGKAPDIRLFFQQSVNTESGHTVLSPSAMFLHSCVHLFLNEEVKHGFRDLTDLYLIAEEHNTPEFWQELYDLAVRSNFLPELFLALRYTQLILKLEVPATLNQQMKDSQPNQFDLFWLDFIFMHILQPSHPIFTGVTDALARAMLLIRGHVKKMPLHILLKHSLHKAWRQTVMAILGSNYFDKEKQT